MSDKKNEIYRFYGYGQGNCSDCKFFKNLFGNFKCQLYGIDNTSDTDWKPYNSACGAKNKDIDLSGINTVIKINHKSKSSNKEPDGQISLFI